LQTLHCTARGLAGHLTGGHVGLLGLELLRGQGRPSKAKAAHVSASGRAIIGGIVASRIPVGVMLADETAAIFWLRCSINVRGGRCRCR
jgi:hypothetical protein